MPEGMAIKAQYSRGTAFRLKLRFGVRNLLLFLTARKRLTARASLLYQLCLQSQAFLQIPHFCLFCHTVLVKTT
jgi:hypothetical protein